MVKRVVNLTSLAVDLLASPVEIHLVRGGRQLVRLGPGGGGRSVNMLTALQQSRGESLRDRAESASHAADPPAAAAERQS